MTATEAAFSFAGKSHPWEDLEGVRLWLVPLPRLREPRTWASGYGSPRYGTYAAVLLRGLAFEWQHRCGPVPRSATDGDAAALGLLLDGLRDRDRRGAFFRDAVAR